MKINYDKESNTVTVAVRELVDFVCRSGDIGGHSRVTAEEGKLAHKRAEDASTQAMLEVPLEYETVIGGVTYRITGRADMIIPGDDGYDTIEEIKTTPSTFFGGTSNIPPAHIAQGVLYAFMWCAGTGRRAAAVRITYVPKKEGRERSFECLFSCDELKAEVSSLISRYVRWAELEIRRECERSASIKAMRFPYGEPREGQVDFMAAVMRAARRRGRLLIQAPTGTGKTMAALYPSVKGLGAGYADRIFYLTAKTSTRLAAEEAAGILLGSSDCLRAISILAKERVCPEAASLRDGAPCSAGTCTRAAGHYDRVTDALWELVGVRGVGHVITSDDITECAERHRVCPYELSLDMSEFCDIIICDYNYVFDPRVCLRRFFDDPDGEHREEKYVLLCDEAHNLVDRAREMYSASVKLSQIERLIPDTERDEELHASLVTLADEVRDLRGRCEEITLDGKGRERGFYVGHEILSEIVSAAAKASDECGREAYFKRSSEDAGDRRLASKLSSLRRALSDFAASADGFDKRHISYIEVCDGDVKCSHICLDASEHLALRMGRASAVVLFSATLQPPDYFARVLGCRDYEALELPSPYDESNLCLLAADKISTRMADREVSAPEIAAMVYAVAMARTGNYICYLPSYRYLELIVREFEGRYGRDDIDIVVSKSQMTERERAQFLSEFFPSPRRTKVGFSVLGGVFSEGVDLPGDRLSGVVIVGVGLPQLSAESNLLRDYYERICERGYEFAYVFPGMNKVLQAAGRVIRGEDDRGVVLLIDDRFGTRDYRELFPAHWRGLRYVGDRRSLGMALRDFWA